MKKKIIFVLSLLFGILFINAGLNKFFNYMPMPTNLPKKMLDVFNAFMQVGWLLPLVGVVEILGGILFIIPKTRALGAIIILPVMVGIILTNTITQQSGLPFALALFAVNVWVILDNKEKYLPMVT